MNLNNIYKKAQKLYQSLRDSRIRTVNLNDEPLPWITFGAINYLKDFLSKKMVAFEWGSGDSTLFFAQRTKRVISVEHVPYWYKKIEKRIGLAKIKNVDLFLIEPVYSEGVDSLYTSDDGKYVGKDFTGLSFEDYVKVIDNFPDEYFDVVCVDGRARPGCIKHALPKIRKSGILLLDNSERPEYQQAEYNMVDWVRTSYLGPGPGTVNEWETTIWQKK